MTTTEDRKLSHINIVSKGGVEPAGSTLLEYVRLVHNPAPEHNLDEVDLHIDFCGHELAAPIVITGMTGGHPATRDINAALAKVAGKYSIGLGVGSQRAGIENPDLAYTFSVVREEAPNAFIIANLGAAQLSRGYGVEEALRAIEMIKANAIAIHLNIGQELFQDEGDNSFSNVIAKIEELVEELPVPIVVKEVGTGLSKEAIARLEAVGVKCFDIAGYGGTNWIKVEALRSRTVNRGRALHEPGSLAELWGNPTAVAVVEARSVSQSSYILGSGGLRDGLDIAKVIALGANAGGLAAPALRALSQGAEGLDRYMADIIYQLKAAVFMTGGTRVSDLWRAPLLVWGRLREELELRGVDIRSYLNYQRLLPLMWRSGGRGVQGT